jgi:ribosomal protein L37AE/L43A
MKEWSKCLGYTGTACPNCGRYRLERYKNGKEICEKCQWCPQEQQYVDRDKLWLIKDNDILKGGE